MTKWRVVLVGATVAGAFAASSFIPANADEQDIVVGRIVYSDGGDDPTKGYIIAQGDDGDPVEGYIGASGPDGGVVGCYGGTFDPAGGNNVILPPTEVPPSAEGPCAPAAP